MEFLTMNKNSAQRSSGLHILSAAILILLLAGCTSIIHKGGEALEGNAFAEKKLAVYRASGESRKSAVEMKTLRHKNGEEALEISFSAWPGLVLRGGAADGGGSFFLAEARILSSHVNGWNELSIQLSGNGFFSSGTDAFIRMEGEVERLGISGGRIRLKGDRITGASALSLLRNRRERILALTEWMKEWLRQNDETQALPGNGAFASQKEFERFWKRLLFPEQVSKKIRPKEYSRENSEWRRADSVNWNKTYTEHLFPEGLWELRNSGALLRDWEEALPWIFIEYSWNTIIESLDGKTLSKARR